MMMRMKASLLCLGWGLALAGLASGCADAAVCENRVHEGLDYTLCSVTAEEDLRVFHSDANDVVLGSFGRVEEQLATEGLRLGFAMNAGMYHDDRRPVGLLIEEGRERAPIVTREGPGNFGMLPNGVFCIGQGRFDLYESRRFDAERPVCRFATQSGPMLVIDGALHPRFLPDSSSRFIRNGVGVSADGKTAYLVISGQAVTFFEFGSFFREALGTPNALYFDGRISRLYAPVLGRNDFGFQMGPIIGLAEPAP
ncbi:MAG: phosphodiester glycosidase family protein [Pseudorhodobacter sp.]